MKNIARDIFFRYNGNHSLMEKSGDYDLYKSFAVPEQVETEWLKEIEQTQIKSLYTSKSVEVDFGLLCRTVCKLRDADGLMLLFQFLNSPSIDHLPDETRLYIVGLFINALSFVRPYLIIEKYVISLEGMLAQMMEHTNDSALYKYAVQMKKKLDMLR